MTKIRLIFEQFNKITQYHKKGCKNFDKNRFNILVESIIWKLRRAEYHIAAYKVCLRDYLRKKPRNKTMYTFRKEYLQRAAFEVEALIETLNSLFDILLQLINVVLSLGLSEGEVSLKAIIKKLDNDTTMQSFCNKIDLHNSQCDKNFAYIRSISNIIKHRKIFSMKGTIRFPIGVRINSDILLLEFTYRKTQYPERYAKELYQKIYPELKDLLISYLKNLADAE